MSRTEGESAMSKLPVPAEGIVLTHFIPFASRPTGCSSTKAPGAG